MMMMMITAFTSAIHFPLYPEPADPAHTIKSYLILFSHLRLGIPSDPFPSGLLTRSLLTLLYPPHVSHTPSLPHLPLHASHVALPT